MRKCCSCALPAAAGAADDDFQFDLFNGKDLAGWDVTNCKVAVEDGALVLKEGNGFVRSNLKYGDFVLELDWRALQADKYDSGIYVRSQFPSAQRNRQLARPLSDSTSRTAKTATSSASRRPSAKA